MTTKPEPLFPTISACPSCGKRTRLKVEKLSHVPRGVDGDRMTRIRSHVETRAQTCERWSSELAMTVVQPAASARRETWSLSNALLR